MAEVNFKNQNNQTVTQQVKPVQVSCTPIGTPYSQTIAPIYNNNGYLSTYQQPYYTLNYGYQVPQAYTQYLSAANVQIQPANQNGQLVQTITNPQSEFS